MLLKWKSVCLAGTMAICLVATSAAQDIDAPVHIGKKGLNQRQVAHPKANPNQQNGNCKALLSQSREMLAQEKQLHQQGHQMELQEVAYNHQAEQVEAQRKALERSMRGGQNKAGTEAQLKSLEQQRIGFEHQAEQQAHERKQIEEQADQINKQRVELERQHTEECGGHHKATPVVN